MADPLAAGRAVIAACRGDDTFEADAGARLLGEVLLRINAVLTPAK